MARLFAGFSLPACLTVMLGDVLNRDSKSWNIKTDQLEN